MKKIKNFFGKIISLPNCYQPNDDKKIISEKKLLKEYNLPENKFIFCNFNRSYKINFKMLNV